PVPRLAATAAVTRQQRRAAQCDQCEGLGFGNNAKTVERYIAGIAALECVKVNPRNAIAVTAANIDVLAEVAAGQSVRRNGGGVCAGDGEAYGKRIVGHTV